MDDGDGCEAMTALGEGLMRVLPAGTMEGVGIEDHLDAAATTGHGAVSLRPRHLREWCAAGPGRSLGRLAAHIDALGLAVSELDPVTGWSDARLWPTGELPSTIVEDLDMAASVGAVAITALVAPGEPWAPGPGAEGLDALCAAARERGLLVQVEPFGWSELWDVTEAAAAVEEIGATNAGVLVDTWHLDRRGGGVSTVEALPLSRVLGLQLSDGPVAAPGTDLRVDCFSARTWPGGPTGELHPERILATLLDRGWSGPVGVEVFGDASGDPLGRARRATKAFDGMLVLIGR